VNGSFLRVNKQKYLKMYSSSIIAVFTTTLLAFASAQSTTTPVTGIRGNATVVENNPVGKVYTATLPEKPFFNPTNPKGNVKGSISATANPNGIGVKFTVKFENLPTSGGPFRRFSASLSMSTLTENQSTISTTLLSPLMEIVPRLLLTQTHTFAER